MFVQVIQGQVSAADEMRASVDHWVQDLAPGATGWLGSTGGVTDDGRFVAVVRFESEQAARANSERPEQDAWWTQASKLMTGEPTFRESSTVDADLNGDPEKAGFVQVMQGRSNDPAKVRELMAQDHDRWAGSRPDILGRLGIGHDDGGFTAVLYFTSEADAREGEAKEPPPELRQQMAAVRALQVGETTFFDLKQPWMHSPG